MGSFEDDLDDNTIGVPRPSVRKPESRMPIERPREVPRIRPVAEPNRPTPRSDRAPSASSDHDEFVADTLMPPRPSRPRPSSPPPARPREEPPARAWSPSPSPVNPGWDDLPDEFDTAVGPSARPNGSSGHDASSIPEQPWTVFPAAPARPPEARIAPQPVDTKTPPAYSKARPAEAVRPARAAQVVHDEARTIGIGDGFHFGVPNRLFTVQYYDGVRHWRDLEQVRPEQHGIGRGSFPHGSPATEFLADDHLRIITEGDQLFVEEGESINGVYRRLSPNHPVDLSSGTRFQVGQHLIEFQIPDPPGPVEPMVSRDGEVFRWRSMAPIAFLDFVGPHGGPGLRFPLTRLDGTIIGREGDIALTGDTWASRAHARITGKNGRFVLEDLGSTNGTFIRIVGRTPLRPGNLQSNTVGDVLLLGAVLVRVVET